MSQLNSEFQKRKSKSEELVNEFHDILIAKNIPFFKSGYEFNQHENNALDKIKYLTDPTSKFIRFYPDVTVIQQKKSLLVEVKNSSGIEKDCWFSYLSLSRNLGVDIFLYLKNKKMAALHDIRFNKVSSFDYVAKMEIPVTDEVWKEPRLLDEYHYQKYKEAYSSAHKYTSGCSFAFIDWDNSKFYDVEYIIT
jgi:hypothetical protein